MSTAQLLWDCKQGGHLATCNDGIVESLDNLVGQSTLLGEVEEGVQQQVDLPA